MTVKRARSRRKVYHPPGKNKDVEDLGLTQKPPISPIGSAVNILTPRTRRKRVNRK